ncbi:hypothetical protein UFOVP45_21 [uncultured Caudovirales phage]|uniref:Uncharacterized protein n=1 Tax=uncultured Caudovirales phage TaxID=2100421 RepID=A0A6J5KUC9_9CAUD|nr:hypothetical protein UFOVP45_21 [uncultured Caudovirales phage]
MATISSLVDRVRLELGDLGKSFVTQFVADGTTNRFKLHYSPLDATSVYISINGVDSSDLAAVEESTGVLVTDTVPVDGSEITVSGTYYRYFTAAELTSLINDALAQHTAKHTDSLGRKITAANLPAIEEYPVAIYAATLALYTLANDAAFDIDIAAPDGVNIPRAQRYRQLMEMMQTRKDQYRELCVQLGIGMYSIDVFSFRRISKATNRYVPVYKPQEVDDRSWPQRAELGTPTYGSAPVEWPTQGAELTAYQDRSFSASVDFSGDFTGQSFVAQVLAQRGSVQVIQNFALTVTDNTDGTFTAVMSLTKDQTLRLPNRAHWSIISVDDTTADRNEVVGANLFTEHEREIVL